MTIFTIWTAIAQPYCRQHTHTSVIQECQEGRPSSLPVFPIAPLGQVVPQKSARWRDAVAVSCEMGGCTRKTRHHQQQPTTKLWYSERPIASETGLFVSFVPPASPGPRTSNAADGEPRFGEGQGQSSSRGIRTLLTFDVSCPMRKADAAEPTGFFCWSCSCIRSVATNTTHSIKSK